MCLLGHAKWVLGNYDQVFPCSSNLECPLDMVCDVENFHCQKSCSSNDQCGDGGQCVSGECKKKEHNFHGADFQQFLGGVLDVFPCEG